jgi:hypothetical protein
MNNIESSKSICILDWIARDGRRIFEKNKIYPHVKSKEIAINGENGVAMFMDNQEYKNHFKPLGEIS